MWLQLFGLLFAIGVVCVLFLLLEKFIIWSFDFRDDCRLHMRIQKNPLRKILNFVLWVIFSIFCFLLYLIGVGFVISLAKGHHRKWRAK